eukprot:gnl/MRDRNA2_/MRDRNA2_73702_c0_seq1.p1 gnl/MRDRNA2_/MRDRNA2_73702_c0~~gnl/MRDRNA2_/MRDRNA2_73702_c0_seq1.p1  ORF type:complete len:389 (-),score=92.52 gnl/MRDRNA2_/MRDRNA2_73702_c0_seq1:4-1170(-)
MGTSSNNDCARWERLLRSRHASSQPSAQSGNQAADLDNKIQAEISNIDGCSETLKKNLDREETAMHHASKQIYPTIAIASSDNNIKYINMFGQQTESNMKEFLAAMMRTYQDKRPGLIEDQDITWYLGASNCAAVADLFDCIVDAWTKASRDDVIFIDKCHVSDLGEQQIADFLWNKYDGSDGFETKTPKKRLPNPRPARFEEPERLSDYLKHLPDSSGVWNITLRDVDMVKHGFKVVWHSFLVAFDIDCGTGTKSGRMVNSWAEMYTYSEWDGGCMAPAWNEFHDHMDMELTDEDRAMLREKSMPKQFWTKFPEARDRYGLARWLPMATWDDFFERFVKLVEAPGIDGVGAVGEHCSFLFGVPPDSQRQYGERLEFAVFLSKVQEAH